MVSHRRTPAVVTFVLATLATFQFATGGPPVAGLTLLFVALLLLFLGGFQVARSGR